MGARDPRDPTFVYFAQACPGAPIKIGLSVRPVARAFALHCPFTKKNLRILAIVRGDLAMEREWLRRFQDRALGFNTFGFQTKSRVCMREWFIPSPELLAAIRAIEPMSLSAVA